MPENTIAAFRNAMERGTCETRKCPSLIYGIEFDVQLSSDGIAVVHHDLRLLPDATRKDGTWLLAPTHAIAELTVAELQQFDVGRLMPQSPHAFAHPRQQAQDGERIPTLRQVLSLARAAQLPPRLVIELKWKPDGDPIALAEAALAAVEEYALVEHSIFVGFDWRGLSHLRRKNPKLQIWCSTHDAVAGSGMLMEMMKEVGGDGWFAHHSQVTPDTVALTHTHGLRLATWTVNEIVEMRRLMGLGVEAICTDYPDLLFAECAPVAFAIPQ